MYGIPDDIDWSFLVGKELLQACIGLHQMQLRFDDDILLSIEGDFDHFRGEGTSLAGVRELPQKAATLLSLLGLKVATVRRRGRKTLALEFSSGETLWIHDSNESCESFQVIARGKEIIV